MWIADNWKEYEVIDCSNGEKLERWGDTFWFVRTLRSSGIPRKTEKNGGKKMVIITAAKKAVGNGSSLTFLNNGIYITKT